MEEKSIFNLIQRINNPKALKALKRCRLEVLKNSEEKEIGINTSISIYNGFLDKNVKLHVTGTYIFENGELKVIKPGLLVFDDDKAYDYLIKSIKENNNPIIAVHQAIKKYSGVAISKIVDKGSKKRDWVYRKFSEETGTPISVKFFHETRLSACAEVSGLSQNMFKFLNIDSDIVVNGTKDENPHSMVLSGHAFNIIYPYGRDSDAFIFDGTFSKGKHPALFYLSKENKEKLLSNEQISLTGEEVERAYKLLLGKKIEATTNMKYMILKDGYADTMSEYAGWVVDKETKELVLKKED